MVLAGRSLGEERRQWSLAMQAEFECAVRDGTPVAFAFGCLCAAWREMTRQEEGRLTLVNHAVAFGLLVPMAALQFECVAGVPYFSLGKAGIYSLLAPGSPQEPYLTHAYHSAIPSLLALWLLLAIGHLRLAWALLQRDWSKLVRIGALTVGASATLVIFTSVLFLDDPGVRLQAMLLSIELIAIYGLARWQDWVSPAGSVGRLAR